MVVKELSYIRSIINLFKDFSEWSKKHFAASLVGILTLVIAALSFIGVVYAYNKIQKAVEDLTKHYAFEEKGNLTPQNTQQAFEKFISRSSIIDNMLRDEAKEQNADRSYLFMFHDSVTGLDSNHFFYMSNTNEYAKKGVSREIQTLQKQPLSMINRWMRAFMKNECVIDHVSSLHEDDAAKGILEMQGIVDLIECPVYSKGILMGFVGFDYVKPYNIENELHLRALAGNVQAVLEVE